MNKEIFLGYIAYFVKNIDQLTDDDYYRAFFVKHLGTSNVVGAPETKIRDVARLMYRAYVASMYIRYSPYYLMTTLSFKDMGEMIANITSTLDQYGVYKSIDDDVSVSNMDKHIKRDALDTYKSVLGKYAPQVSKPAPSKPAPKKRAAPQKKATVPKKPVSKSKAPAKAPAKKAVAKGKVKVCADYKLPELKEMAKAKKLTGYSKMNKSTLCSALGVKS
jgi:hypothetical protein